MINLIESPINGNKVIDYRVNGEVLIVTLDGVTEEFDFTNIPEGQLETIELEVINYPPILSARKDGEIITVEVVRFYSGDEKALFETGEPVTISFGGGVIG